MFRYYYFYRQLKFCINFSDGGAINIVVGNQGLLVSFMFFQIRWR